MQHLQNFFTNYKRGGEFWPTTASSGVKGWQLSDCAPSSVAMRRHLPHPKGREGTVSVVLCRIWCVDF